MRNLFLHLKTIDTGPMISIFLPTILLLAGCSIDNIHSDPPIESNPQNIPQPKAPSSDIENELIPSSNKPLAPNVDKFSFIPDNLLKICPRIKVSNSPAAVDGIVTNYNPIFSLNGVSLLAAPVRDACLSSGYGVRGTRNRLHKGIDYHQRPAGPVFAAAQGVILERVVRDDYGNMILIDHSNGVYTRYAHLENFSDKIEVGANVDMGTELGIMGSSGATRAIHLHYEVLTGDYKNPKRSFGLTPVNIFPLLLTKAQ